MTILQEAQALIRDAEVRVILREAVERMQQQGHVQAIALHRNAFVAHLAISQPTIRAYVTQEVISTDTLRAWLDEVLASLS